MNDRRRSPVRRQTALLLGSPEDPRLFGRTRNLSFTGAFVETEARPPVGATREIAIAWGDDLLECQARVARHADDGMGLAFLTPDKLFVDALQEIIGTSPPDDLLPRH